MMKGEGLEEVLFSIGAGYLSALFADYFTSVKSAHEPWLSASSSHVNEVQHFEDEYRGFRISEEPQQRSGAAGASSQVFRK